MSASQLTSSKPPLTIQALCDEAAAFAEVESSCDEPKLYGVTDGKKVGTHLERKFMDHLQSNYAFSEGNSASGIDIPDLGVDIKTTSIRQPQSSCPFESPHQKIYGIGYHLIIFVYDKSDDHEVRTGHLHIAHTIFVERNCTADYQMTRYLRQIIENDGNVDDIISFLQDKNLPVDDMAARNLAERILEKPPLQGYLTISNALQWRLQYGRVIDQAGKIPGIKRVR